MKSEEENDDEKGRNDRTEAFLLKTSLMCTLVTMMGSGRNTSDGEDLLYHRCPYMLLGRELLHWARCFPR